MSAASPPDVDLAFGSGIGLHDFSGSAGLSNGRKADFADEFALLAGLQAARLGGFGRPGMVAGARNAGRVVQSGCGQLSHLGVCRASIFDELARIPDGASAGGKEPLGPMVAGRLP